MSGWAAKRFWDNATVELAGHAFEVRLDGRPVRTPLKAPLHVPTAKMAEAIAVEWQALSILVPCLSHAQPMPR
jgi:chaperone required for assembly of F1-ATPase